MVDFKLRGKVYPIKVIGTLGNKIEACVKNKFASPADDARAAYVLTRACPDIPPEIAYYTSESDFNFTLTEIEFTLFSGFFTWAMLEKQLGETQNSTERGIIEQSIKSIKSRLAEAEKQMSLAIAQNLLKEMENLKPISSEPIDIDAEVVQTAIEVNRQHFESGVLDKQDYANEEIELQKRLQQIQAAKAKIAG